MRFPVLKGKAVLSPMAGVTDIAFRALAKTFGAALTYTEFLSGTAIVRGNLKTIEMLRTDEIETPAAVQLFGNCIEDVVEAARIVQNKFDVIDINCGCPAWKVIRTGAGSEMLKEPSKIASFVNKVASAVSVPVTVKIRSGIDDTRINAVEVAMKAEDAGAAAITIHGRTQKQGYSGVADWKIIKAVKDKVNIPVIGNGDVFTPETFAQRLEQSGVDAIMVARGAMTNPYIFTQINEFLKNGCYSSKRPSELFIEYLAFAYKHSIKFQTIKQHAISFAKGIPLGAKIRAAISTAESVEEIKVAIGCSE